MGRQLRRSRETVNYWQLPGGCLFRRQQIASRRSLVRQADSKRAGAIAYRLVGAPLAAPFMGRASPAPTKGGYQEVVRISAS